MTRTQAPTASKGGKGIGKKFIARPKPVDGITDPTLRRLARRQGVKRISKSVYKVTRLMIEEFLERVMDRAILYAHSNRRKTLYMSDVEHGLRLAVRPHARLHTVADAHVC